MTALEFKLYPIAAAYAGVLFFPLERGAEVLRAWRRWVEQVPEEVTSVGRFLQFPPIPDIPEPLADFNDAAIDAMVRSAGAESGSPLLSVEVRHMGGALGRKAPGAGALAAIEGRFLMFAVGLTVDAEAMAAVKAHVELVQTAFAPWDSGRMYLNFAEKCERGERLFGDATYRRLQAVKAAVDPDDVFRSNHPIRLPAASSMREAA